MGFSKCALNSLDHCDFFLFPKLKAALGGLTIRGMPLKHEGTKSHSKRRVLPEVGWNQAI
jgi:hypothetical protein